MSITLDQADSLIAAVLASASGMGPITVVVTDAGGAPKAFKKQDGGYLLDFETALGRAFAALSLSPGTSEQLAAQSLDCRQSSAPCKWWGRGVVRREEV